MKIHNDKLKQIEGRNAKPRRTAKSKTSTLRDVKQKANAFAKSEKNQAINRENQMLLNKLVEISQGKHSVIAQPVKKRPSSQSKRSLNFGTRKKEFERIERENMKIAQRLFNKESNISKKQQEKEFISQVKYKMQIQKAQAATTSAPIAKQPKQTKVKGKAKLITGDESAKEEVEYKITPGRKNAQMTLA